MKLATAKRRSALAAACFETLENRQFMSVTPYVIHGTAGHDVINVNYGLAPIYSTTSLTTTKTATTFSTSTSKIQLIDPTIFNQLTVTVNGVTSYPKLTTGQGLQVNGYSGNDRITVSGSLSTILNGGDGDDTLIGGGGQDTISGNNGNDFVDAGLGNDVAFGNAGTDTISYASRSAGVTVRLDGYANDGQAGETDNISADFEVVRGGWGNDSLFSNASDYVGRTLMGNGGNDNLVGGYGNDTLRGGAGDDTSVGNGGNDLLFADSGLDGLYGGDGNDRIYGGTSADYIRAGNGDDLIITIGGGQADRIYGDGGTDSFWLDAESTEVISDATTGELKTNTHRVARYETLRVNGTVVGTPSREMNVGNLPDPNTRVNDVTYAYRNFASTPLFNNNMPIAADVNQGKVGDCYFMAPLSAIAKTSPNVIRQSVVDLGDGTFAVKLRRDGVARYVRVDADLPVNDKGNLVFAHARSAPASLWAPIMEKAWAFFRNSTGTYAGIASGFPKEAFRTLGMANGEYDPYAWFNDSPQEFGSKLADLLAQGKSVTLCTDTDGKFLEDLHCYAVERVNKIGSTVVSIILRNPWGYDGKGADSVSDDGFLKLDATQALASCQFIGYGNP